MDSDLFDAFKYLVATSLSPLLISLFLQAFAIILWWREKQTAALRTFACGWIILILGSLSGWTYDSARRAEFIYPPFQLERLETKPSSPWVVVLGSGFNSDPELPYTSQVGGTFLARLLEGVRVQQLFPESRLIVSIAGRASDSDKRRFFEQMAKLLQLDPQRVDLILDAKSTDDETLAVKSRNPSEPIIVVTSAGHMPRAMIAFASTDLAPIAAPTDYSFVRAGSPNEKTWPRWIPSADGIGANHGWLYEKVAIVWQMVKGSVKLEE
jgi:uncharacterized SAM-binding protein YcdF (DUF218 family)